MKEICRKRADAGSPDSGDGRISRSIRNTMLFSYNNIIMLFLHMYISECCLYIYTKEHQQCNNNMFFF